MKRNLLIADDEELIRKGLIARLNYLGFAFGEILEAETGTEALEAVRENSISIVITDIRMPDMTVWSSSGRPRNSPLICASWC